MDTSPPAPSLAPGPDDVITGARIISSHLKSGSTASQRPARSPSSWLSPIRGRRHDETPLGRLFDVARSVIGPSVHQSVRVEESLRGRTILKGSPCEGFDCL